MNTEITSIAYSGILSNISSVLARAASKRLAERAEYLSEPADMVNLAFNFNSIGIGPIQVKEEFLQLVKLVSAIKPKALLKVGTANDGTLFSFSRVAQPDATMYR